MPANWYWPVIIFLLFFAAMVWGWGGISYQDDDEGSPSWLELSSPPGDQQEQQQPGAPAPQAGGEGAAPPADGRRQGGSGRGSPPA